MGIWVNVEKAIEPDHSDLKNAPIFRPAIRKTCPLRRHLHPLGCHPATSNA